MLRKLGITIIAFVISTAASGATGYICIPDASTGFAFNKSTKNWHSTNFNVDNEKYLLSVRDGLWSWKTLGEDDFGIPCSDFNEYGYMNCTLLTEITFNRTNLRFMAIYRIGYVSAGIAEGTEGSDTPHISIGKCSPL